MENIIIDVIYDNTQIYHVLEPNLEGIRGVPMQQRMVRDSIKNIKVLLGHLAVNKIIEFENELIATQRIKANIANPNVHYIGFPSTFVFKEIPYSNYEDRTDLHYAHGWRSVVMAEYDSATQKIAENYSLIGEVISQEIIQLTDEEILENNKPIVPREVSAIQFISQLSFEGISEEAVMQVIETLPEPNRTVAKVSYQRARIFERNNPLMQLVSIAFNKTEAEMDEIFINAKNI